MVEILGSFRLQRVTAKPIAKKLFFRSEMEDLIPAKEFVLKNRTRPKEKRFGSDVSPRQVEEARRIYHGDYKDDDERLEAALILIRHLILLGSTETDTPDAFPEGEDPKGAVKVTVYDLWHSGKEEAVDVMPAVVEMLERAGYEVETIQCHGQHFVSFEIWWDPVTDC